MLDFAKGPTELETALNFTPIILITLTLLYNPYTIGKKKSVEKYNNNNSNTKD